MLAGILGREYFDDNPVVLMIPSLLFSTMLFYIGYTGYIHKFSVVDFNFDNIDKGSNGDVKDTHHGIQVKPEINCKVILLIFLRKSSFLKELIYGLPMFYQSLEQTDHMFLLL